MFADDGMSVFLFLSQKIWDHFFVSIKNCIILCSMNIVVVFPKLLSGTTYCRAQDLDFSLRITLERKVEVCYNLYPFVAFEAFFYKLRYIQLDELELSLNTLLDGMRDNDWTCPKCGNVNFSFRTVCNMRKCNTPRPGSQVCATTS